MSEKYVYAFGKTRTDGNATMKNELGGKGANLAEMTSIGVPVPPGFTIPCDLCNYYYENNKTLPSALADQIKEVTKLMEEETGAEFGSSENPLLVSVRSGARVSMPGMMNTVLNLGLNDVAVEGLAAKTGNARMAYDSYRRFIEMFSDVVKEIPGEKFHHVWEAAKSKAGAQEDNDLSTEDLKEVCTAFQAVYKDYVGEDFPQNPFDQLDSSIKAVFNSWNTERAILYRKMENIPNNWGTAVNVQAMAFGNKGDTSATGVAFTRNPSTGENLYYGEYLINAQGEDVVAGIRTPIPISKVGAAAEGFAGKSLEEVMPGSYRELTDVFAKLEKHYKDMQDIEFTIDEGKLFILQTRTGKRTGFAQVKIAVEMEKEGLIDSVEGLKRIQPSSLEQLLSPVFNFADKDAASASLVGKGLNAGPGAASGKLALTSAKALEYKEQGIPSVLVRIDTSPADFGGMMAAEGVLTARGGATSHAAVVARQFGKPCVCGLASLSINDDAKTLSSNGQTIKEGDPISIDGSTGEVFFTMIKTSPSEVNQVLVDESLAAADSNVYQNFKTVMEWSEAHKTLDVRTNADSPRDVQIAINFGAVGIGLTRVEHMFHGTSRLLPLRQLVLSDKSEVKRDALIAIEKFIAEDFKGIFRALNGLPATVRLLDPPMHEFMPHSEAEKQELADSLNIDLSVINEALENMKEVNPMLGHRGCRLGVSSPAITRMQVRAILESAIAVQEEGITCVPEIMVPIVMSEKELEHQKQVIEHTAEEVFEDCGKKVKYTIGTMIELPRACLRAAQIAEHAEFFSFGTNDLTQTTFGVSRDDAGKFLPIYSDGVPSINGEGTMEIYPNDPFQVLDQDGVGELVKIGVERGRSVKPNLKIGICGEHGGEPSSVEFCHKAGLNYVSCSPYRVPIAKLAAAQAAINN
ncbi:MAG: pyruvate, phosphate dikinase [Lentisphaeraceae bacterium]|nr:pyruvate, phosphate dikinase [Lentisphaeraceae bacterium]